MARILTLDPVIIMAETDPELNAVRQAAAIVASNDDKAEAERMKAKKK